MNIYQLKINVIPSLYLPGILYVVCWVKSGLHQVLCSALQKIHSAPLFFKKMSFMKSDLHYIQK